MNWKLKTHLQELNKKKKCFAKRETHEIHIFFVFFTFKVFDFRSYQQKNENCKMQKFK